MTTYCEDCEHAHAENDKRSPHRWMCVKFPRVEADNFVTKDLRRSDPYMYCYSINGGACPVFKRKKGPQMEMQS